MIRLRLEASENISSLHFDIPRRILEVCHSGDYLPIFQKIDALQLDASVLETASVSDISSEGKDAAERKLLWQVLIINFFFFGLEVFAGFIANSMGLLADSLDMLADSFVYALALFAVGKAAARKKSVAGISGYFQLFLAVLGVIEVLRRFLGMGDVPAFQTMIVVSVLALIGNATCLYLLQKSTNNEAHMQASRIFTSNDVIINIGVIVAGILVFATHSRIPDLAIGTIVFFIVARGAYRILQISR
ncbi:MAG TPA: cation transporter [Smithellaceae bacterium]|nr:cation transporter [Smithellaceae bacterium]